MFLKILIGFIIFFAVVTVFGIVIAFKFPVSESSDPSSKSESDGADDLPPMDVSRINVGGQVRSTSASERAELRSQFSGKFKVVEKSSADASAWVDELEAVSELEDES